MSSVVLIIFVSHTTPHPTACWGPTIHTLKILHSNATIYSCLQVVEAGNITVTLQNGTSLVATDVILPRKLIYEKSDWDEKVIWLIVLCVVPVVGKGHTALKFFL